MASPFIAVNGAKKEDAPVAQPAGTAKRLISDTKEAPAYASAPFIKHRICKKTGLQILGGFAGTVDKKCKLYSDFTGS